MQIIEIRRQGESISGRMAEMRTWLQHHGMEAHLLELSFLPAKEVRFRLQFRDPREEAAAFARVLTAPRRRAPGRASSGQTRSRFVDSLLLARPGGFPWR